MKYLRIQYFEWCVFQVINDILPTKARKEVDRLIAESQDAQFQLEFEPTVTIEYVKSLMFLDQIQERVGLRRL
jgi:dynein heavy chain